MLTIIAYILRMGWGMFKPYRIIVQIISRVAFFVLSLTKNKKKAHPMAPRRLQLLLRLLCGILLGLSGGGVGWGGGICRWLAHVEFGWLILVWLIPVFTFDWERSRFTNICLCSDLGLL